MFENQFGRIVLIIVFNYHDCSTNTASYWILQGRSENANFHMLGYWTQSNFLVSLCHCVTNHGENANLHMLGYWTQSNFLVSLYHSCNKSWRKCEPSHVRILNTIKFPSKLVSLVSQIVAWSAARSYITKILQWYHRLTTLLRLTLSFLADIIDHFLVWYAGHIDLRGHKSSPCRLLQLFFYRL